MTFARGATTRTLTDRHFPERPIAMELGSIAAVKANARAGVGIALLSRFWLHETLSFYRWAGIALIVCAVGFVAGGPSRTEHPDDPHELGLMDSGAGR